MTDEERFDHADELRKMALDDFEVTGKMIEAGVEALEHWYGEPGEPENFKRRAVEDIIDAVLQVMTRESHD